MTDPLVEAQLVTPQQAQGADLFFRGTFGGNGRTCGTCHRVENNQTIDPAFIATLLANDPLFVAEQEPATLGFLEKPALMRPFGLILAVTTRLGAEMRLPSSTAQSTVVRSTPSSFVA